MDLLELVEHAKNIRKHAIKMVTNGKASHIGSALSIIDILTTLYFEILAINPERPKDPNRDIFILSKGHSSVALYATLAERGYFPMSFLDEFYKDGGKLLGHSTLGTAPGIEASTGSLGHGLSLGIGMALASRYDKKKSRVFVLLSDGECDEGSTWEAIMSAGHYKLNNVIAIIDYNKIQSFGNVKEVMDLEPFSDKWRSFGWRAEEVDGHKIQQLVNTFSKIPFEGNKPTAIICHTIKGKGISFMENKLEWHYHSPNEKQCIDALKELDHK